ncbi:MAG: DUF3850 domain-containing protein [bacterium]|nr:DUF3850 domain-containing protein [bacterium]
MIIKKKIWTEYFEKVASGEKKFEVRLADFEVNEGDTLVLEEWDHKKNRYTGRRVETKVSFVVKTKELTFWNQDEIDKKGYQIIQIEV